MRRGEFSVLKAQRCAHLGNGALVPPSHGPPASGSKMFPGHVVGSLQREGADRPRHEAVLPLFK